MRVREVSSCTPWMKTMTLNWSCPTSLTCLRLLNSHRQKLLDNMSRRPRSNLQHKTRTCIHPGANVKLIIQTSWYQDHNSLDPTPQGPAALSSNQDHIGSTDKMKTQPTWPMHSSLKTWSHTPMRRP